MIRAASLPLGGGEEVTPAHRRTMLFERAIGYQGLALRVAADEAAALEWLIEFLAPHFALQPDRAPADCTVSLARDAREFGDRRARGPIAGAPPVDGFALDNSVVPFVEWTSDSGERTLFDEHTQTFVRLVPETRAVELLADGTSPRPRTALMRVVRELAMHRAQRDGGLFLHAAAVAFGESALVIAGPKAAGKTSLLIHLLGQPGARYVANDRVLARFEGDLRIVGMPTIVTVRPGTLERFPELARRLRESHCNHRLSFAENARAAQPSEPWSDGRFGLSPPQLCRLLDVEARAGARPRALLFPTLTLQPGALELVPIEARAAAARLADALFGIRTWRKSFEIFDFDGDPPIAEHDRLALAERFAERVPAFECRLGDDAYRAPETTRRALAQVLS